MILPQLTINLATIYIAIVFGATRSGEKRTPLKVIKLDPSKIPWAITYKTDYGDLYDILRVLYVPYIAPHNMIMSLTYRSSKI